MAHTILLVEDEDDDVFFFKTAMAKAGIVSQLHVARDGQEALDYFQGTGKFQDRAQFPLPDLMFLDLKLPKVMGLEVLKWIRQQPELASIVVILSSSSDREDVATAYRLGANAYLVKPTDISHLMKMVSCVHDFWLRYNTRPPRVISPARVAH
jgi:DNA-binding response OmpR family regulator